MMSDKSVIGEMQSAERPEERPPTYPDRAARLFLEHGPQGRKRFGKGMVSLEAGHKCMSPKQAKPFKLCLKAQTLFQQL